MNLLKETICYYYIALWIMYYLQDMLSIKGIVAHIILVVLMAMSIYAFCLVNIFYRISLYLKWLNIMLLVVTVYGLVLFFSGFALYPNEFNLYTNLQFGYLQRIYTSILPIYFFYLFSLKKEISERNMKSFFLVFLLFSIIMYYQNFFVVSEAMERNEITNNIGYWFVPLIPMLLLIKIKDIWKFVFLTVVFAFIMMSMKRGAILVGTVALLLYLKHLLNYKSTKQKVYVIVLSMVVICVIYLFVMNLYESSHYFKVRFSSTLEGDTSNRSWMYPLFFDYFVHHTTDMEFLFGCGADATYSKFGVYAHNDWLEFAINQGIFGVILYSVYWGIFVREWFSYHGPHNCKLVLGDLIIIYMLKSCFSMSFDGMATVATLCIGYCLANNVKYKRLVNRL